MSSVPSRRHQEVFGRVYNPVYGFLRRQACKVYAAPFDVRIPRKFADEKEVITVLQPDICVVCDSSKLDDKGCLGAPNIINPDEKNLIRCTLSPENRFFAKRPFTIGDTLLTPVLPGFALDMTEVFEDLD